METDAKQHIPEETNQKPEGKTKKTKKVKNEKFKWWQTLLILSLTLVISVGAAYYISDKYFWSKMDMNHVSEQLDYYKNKVDSEPNEPKHRVNLGYTYFLKGDNDEAIKQLKVALDLDKKNYDAYLNLSIVYKDQGELDNALKAAEKCVDLNPRDYKGLLQKGSIYRELKMYKDSLETLNQANSLMPGNTDIIYEIGRLAEAQGQMKEAEAIYKDALNYDPLYKNALKGLERIASKDSNKK
ncbi:tetratricopeptide repeat protein [Bacillus sp. ISL-40]|uniref:tetratricopeptide repeat protein n=1 Tax=unclassified Bacillus (in: firmicutes) TaxID=185979 RepID=UPI001BE76646|nr:MULTISPECIES: tetratricopeptide repeat protein [unclassified Bacillus (in: firmicutes)]MBT2698194.1 tetratricopeptide repeat protein [Bacillus sp. ISL-40]MBT2741984.1 tetratricopeptide repeat protein [Bacillus sp. ISL-77]